MPAAMIAGLSEKRLQKFARSEGKRFSKDRPLAACTALELQENWLSGVPMHWMSDWPMPFLPIIAKAKAAQITDIDGHRLDDFCLGDTGAMFGHAPPALIKAITTQARHGLSYMLPSDLAQETGALLSSRFGDMRWQIATTATDANRFAIRVARAVTGRPKILVFNGCYHGTVDDVMVDLDAQGSTRTRPGQMGQIRDLSDGAVVCEFNDLSAVETALSAGDVAAILTEPVMTNSAMVLPAPGFHAGLRSLATRYGALLMIDETHTQSSGQGGYSRQHGLHPDVFIIGKCVAGGMPTALWGLNDHTAARYQAANAARPPGHSGMGTTLSGNPMQLACLRATLSQIMTDAAWTKMEKGAQRLEAGLAQSIRRHDLPWHVVRVGARVEFICAPGPLRNGTEAGLAHQPQIEAALHLALLNRGSLIAPFHNMMLISPVTKKRQIDRLITSFDSILSELLS